MALARANLAEYTKQVSAAGMAMDKDFGTAMQKTYVKVVAFNKILGPFYNLWLKFKTGVGALLSPMKALLVPFGIMEKTVDGIRMSFLSMIGILFTVISVFAYLTSSVGSAGGGTNELMASLGGLKDILLGVIQQIMAFAMSCLLITLSLQALSYQATKQQDASAGAAKRKQLCNAVHCL